MLYLWEEKYLAGGRFFWQGVSQFLYGVVLLKDDRFPDLSTPSVSRLL
jgi:hypothetical protein